jgi:hypothetical protein
VCTSAACAPACVGPMPTERWGALALLALGACAGDAYLLGEGRPPSDRPTGAPIAMDAGLRDDLPDDPPVDARGPAPTAPPISEPLRPAYGTPVAIMALSGPDGKDDDPTFTSDRTLLFFNSTRSGGVDREDVWFAARGAIGEPFGAPAPVAELNTERRETGLALSPDGLTIWFSSDREGGAGGLDIYVATRNARSQSFGAPARVPALSSARDDLVSAIDPSLLTIYLARRDDDDDDYDLFIAERSNVGLSFSAPRPIDELNTDDEESDAFGAQGGSALVFTREGDLHLARRSGPGQPFVEQPGLAELNSPRDDRDCWASDDLRYVIFASNRTDKYLLYEASR